MGGRRRKVSKIKVRLQEQKRLQKDKVIVCDLNDRVNDDEEDEEALQLPPPAEVLEIEKRQKESAPIPYADEAQEIDEVSKIAWTLFEKESMLLETMNIPMSDLARDIAELDARSIVVLSAEQTNKTVLEVGIMKSASVMRKPSILIVQDVKGNVENLCDTKAGVILQQLGMEMTLLSSAKDFEEFATSPSKMQRFISGRTTLVVQALAHNIRRLQDTIIYPHDVSDIVLILDESDAIWSSNIDPTGSDWMKAKNLTAREHEMYRLIVGMDSDGRGHKRLFGNGRIRSLFSVSATHMVTVPWHLNLWKTPFKGRGVELQELKRRGYAVYNCLEPLKNTSGRPMFLDPAMQTKRGDYNIKSGGAMRMLDVFHEDSVDPSKKALMMMASMTPYVRTPQSQNAQNEKVPRLTERLDEGPLRRLQDSSNKTRISSLGNAVVPVAVTAAWNILVDAIHKGQHGEVPELPTWLQGRRDPVNLRMGHHNELERTRWVTPVHSITHAVPYLQFAGRSANMLANQVFHEHETKKVYRYRSIERARKKYCLNPEWVEALMGFPVKWTWTK